MLRSLLSFLFLSIVSAQTVYLAGDSTMALGGGGSGTQGNGALGPQKIQLNLDRLGSSRFYLDTAKKFGHNDATSGAVDNGKQDAVGDGYNITSTVTAANQLDQGQGWNTHHMFARIFPLQRRSHYFLASVTPDNIWTGNTIAAGGRFVTYAQSIGVDTSIAYVDHYNYVAQAYNKLGQTAVTAFYPIDHLHTSAAGALVVSEAFVRGLLCGNSTLRNFVNAQGQAAPSASSLPEHRLSTEINSKMAALHAHVILFLDATRPGCSHQNLRLGGHTAMSPKILIR
ncbi:rhamnogalacturonan acetylesterase [Mycena vitilis]|nr:rhamnogalacturonan acetylesterase [Mycena vitilis]